MLKISEEKAIEMILRGERIPLGTTIAGGLNLNVGIKSHLAFRGVTIEGDLAIKTIIKGSLDLEGAIIKGYLYLYGATIKGYMNLRGATIKKDLFLKDTVIEGYIDLMGTTVGGDLSLVLKSGPDRILVSSHDMAQIAHWTAPTTPIIVIK